MIVGLLSHFVYGIGDHKIFCRPKLLLQRFVEVGMVYPTTTLLNYMNISNYLTLVLFEGGASKHVFKRGENLVGELLFFFGDQVDLLAQFFSLEKQKTNALVHTLRSNTIDPFYFPYFFHKYRQ